MGVWLDCDRVAVGVSATAFAHAGGWVGGVVLIRDIKRYGQHHAHPANAQQEPQRNDWPDPKCAAGKEEE